MTTSSEFPTTVFAAVPAAYPTVAPAAVPAKFPTVKPATIPIVVVTLSTRNNVDLKNVMR